MATDLSVKSSHLKPFQFKPGQSGNPGGHGGGRKPSLTNLLMRELALPSTQDPTRSQLQWISKELARLASEPGPDQFKAICEVFNRLYGRAHQSISVASTNDEDFQNMVQLFINECQRMGLESSQEDAETYLAETVIEVQAENVTETKEPNEQAE